jgi:hypothetical protein
LTTTPANRKPYAVALMVGLVGLAVGWAFVNFPGGEAIAPLAFAIGAVPAVVGLLGVLFARGESVAGFIAGPREIALPAGERAEAFVYAVLDALDGIYWPEHNAVAPPTATDYVHVPAPGSRHASARPAPQPPPPNAPRIVDPSPRESGSATPHYVEVPSTSTPPAELFKSVGRGVGRALAWTGRVLAKGAKSKHAVTWLQATLIVGVTAVVVVLILART